MEDNIKMGLIDRYVVCNQMAYDRDQGGGFCEDRNSKSHLANIRVLITNSINYWLLKNRYFSPLGWCVQHRNIVWSHRDGPKLTLRRLMSYIYGAPILDVSRSHTTTQYSR